MSSKDIVLAAAINALAVSHRFGAICTTPGNLCLCGGAERTRTSNQAVMSRHPGWEDSNLQPNDYQPLALDIEQPSSL
jgi:hypothetical protein